MGEIFGKGRVLMARPKKLSDGEMVKIVDSFYETNGNPDMLKSSLLEEYAISIGNDGVKAYDFRRNTAVRKRIEELKDLSPVSGGGAIAYKSLDVDALLAINRTKPMLRNALLELDVSWRRIYERTSEMSRKNADLNADNKKISLANEVLSLKNSELSAHVTALNKSNKDLALENRYLKKMLKQYLYPAIANEILVRENVLEQSDTEVTLTAMEKMTDLDIPSPFPSSVSADRELLSREESLLERIKNQINTEDDDDA